MKLVALAVVANCAAQDVFLGSPARTVSKADLVRAKSTQQSGRLGGSTPHEIAEKINNHISGLKLPVKSCDAYSLDELNALVRDMYPHLNEDLQDLYAENDGRSRRFATLEEYEKSWEADDEHALETIRDAKCADALMLWAHHLTEGGKKVFADRELPTLPVYDAAKGKTEVYAKATSCLTGHSMKKGDPDGASTHQWPDWPEELHYTAKGHGAYPFWWGGGSDSGTADMEVWWSEKQGAELFYHSSCTGTYKWQDGSPCYHLMLAAEPDKGIKRRAYLYNEDASHCCITSGLGEPLAPAQGTFWNTFQYVDERDFNGVYYQGKAKYYKLTGVNEPVTDFWYFTDLDGKPVQQGEAGTGPTDQGYPTSIGHTIWHDYNPASLDTSPINSTVFEIPAYCQQTTTKCQFPR